MYVEYDSNNSGGSWWLTDDDWKALEDAGWIVEWASLECLYDADGRYVKDKNGIPKLVPLGQGNSRFGVMFVEKDDCGVFRYMGALARKAYRVGLSLREAAEEFDKVTSQTSTDSGCPCCGQPHNFTEYDDNGSYVASGPDADYICSW